MSFRPRREAPTLRHTATALVSVPAIVLAGLLAPLPALADGTAVVRAADAAVHTAPAEVAPVIANVARGGELSVADVGERGWRVVTLADGRRGYARDADLRLPVSVGSVGGGAALRGENPGPTVSGRTAIRLVGRISGISLAGGGLEVSQRFGTAFGVAGTLSYEDFGGDNPGMGAEVLGRFYVGRGPHNLSLGAGPALRRASAYGAIGFLGGEIAYEYLYPGGLGVLFGVGGDVVLNDSGTATCRQIAVGDCILFESHYDAGQALLRLRLAVGASF